MAHRMMIAGVTMSVIVAWAAPAMAQQDPTGAWASKQNGQNFYQGASASDGTYLYVIGGYQAGVVSNSYPWYYNGLRRYDPAGNTWTTLTEPSSSGYSFFGLYGNAGGYHNGRIFSFGGYHFYGDDSTSYSSFYSDAILSYDIATDTWSTLTATLSVARYLLSATAVATSLGDRIYVMGGTGNGNGVNDEFDPMGGDGTGSIVNRATMPAQLYYHAMSAARVNNVERVYCIGGYPGPTAACYEYTPPASSSDGGSWATKSPIQNSSGQTQPRYAAIGMTLDNRIYVTGGFVNNNYTNETWEYNPVTDLWARRANMGQQHSYHAGATISGKGYVFGGLPTYSTCEEFTPPTFGSGPNAPTNVRQSGIQAEASQQALSDASQFNGWTNNQISFSATVTDPDAAQQVRLRVRVKNVSSSTWTTLDSGLFNQGQITVNWTIPANGQYDWQYRVEDSFTNSYPDAVINAAYDAGWVNAFNNAISPDFRSDQIPPADPIGVAPSGADFQVPDPNVGNVTLRWLEATDNGPVTGISYELQVARDGAFIDIEAQLFSTAGTDTYPVALTVSRYEKYWRIRARDVGGNLSNWSPSLTFRVTYNDGANHSAGDAGKVCGFGAGPAHGTGSVALCGWLIIMGGLAARYLRAIRSIHQEC